MIHRFISGLFCCLFVGIASISTAVDISTMEEITPGGFKTFQIPYNVSLYRVSFDNQYGMQLVGYLFMPKELPDKAAAIIIGIHPSG